MKHGLFLAGAVAALLSSLPAQQAAAESYGMFDAWRCSQDNLSTAAAQARLDFGFKCLPAMMDMLGYQLKIENNMHPFAQGVVPAYPVFGTRDAAGAVTVIPAAVDASTSCDWLQTVAPGSKVMIVGYCGVGCMTPDQLVAFKDGEIQIGSAEARKQTEIVTLADGAKLDSMTFKMTPLRQIVSDMVDTKQVVLTISTATGGQLKVTENHPLVDQEGRVRRADKFAVGDSLVQQDGSLDAVTSVVRNDYFGKVYNVRISSPKLEDNIYLAQGFLNGSIGLQNGLVKYLNRHLLRHGDLIDLGSN